MQAKPTALTAEALNDYRNKGFLILPGVFSAQEAKAFQAESDRLHQSDLVIEGNLRTPMYELPNGERKVERIDPVIDISELFNGVIYDERITTPLEQIFGEPARLFKDKLIFKYPEVRGYSMHQDYAWWQPQGDESPLPGINPDNILSVMIAIDPATAENGAVELFPGYQKELLSPVGALRNMIPEEIAKIDLSTGVLGTTQPGDVIIFHSLAPHRSGSNCSTVSRRQLYMTYNAASAGDAYTAQQEHYRAYASRSAKRGEKFFR